MTDKPWTLHVISHTHWDREWYRSFQEFRFRLVDLVDYLLDLLESNPSYPYFHLDGQTVVLQDYLEIRPEHEQRLRDLVAQNRILVGPWFILPDEFLVSGEAMIRNLVRGHQMAEDFGAVMKVGYIPDTFGHISQMPQILRGFGIDNAILFRGITADQAKSEFLWQGSDGSVVLTANMSDDTAYSNFFYELEGTLTAGEEIDGARLHQEVDALIAERAAQAVSNHLLGMDGVDHVFPNPKTVEVLRWIRDHREDIHPIHTTLPAYMQAVGAHQERLETIQGELRISNRKWRLQAILAGVLSSRMHLKQQNEAVQTLLEKWVEPLSTAAWLQGEPYPARFIEKAWEYVLLNHPHDSICGCSVDQVHRDMVYRNDQATLIGEQLVQRACAAIASRVDTSTLGTDGAVLMVFNPCSWPRAGVVRVEVDLPVRHGASGLEVYTAFGQKIPHQMLGRQDRWIRHQDPHDIPRSEQVTRYTLAVDVEEVPALGYAVYQVRQVSVDAACADGGVLAESGGSLENEKLQVRVNDDGTLAVLHKQTGQVYQDMLYFELGGDEGDGYNYRKPTDDQVMTTLGGTARTKVLANGPLLAGLEVEVGTDSWGLTAVSEIWLASGSPRLDVVTRVHNQRKNHRLRVLFPTGVTSDVSHAESQFDIVSRPISTPDGQDWLEPPPSCHPQLGFVDIHDGQRGLGIINKGLPEYEVLEARSTIALTLLRAVGNGVGEPEELVEGQCLGDHTFSYAIVPHDGDLYQARLWQDGYNHNVPMRTYQTDRHTGSLPLTSALVAHGCDEVTVTAVKKCETRDSVIVRLLNLSVREQTVCLRFGFDAAEVYRVNLNEQRQELLGDSDHKEIALTMGSKELVTLELVV